MEIKIHDFVAGAKEARGITVIIDVFRAFSTACYAFSQGAKRIIPVAKPQEAFEWKRKDPSVLLIGERHAKKIDGFDFGNSPSELISVNLSGRTLIHTTHAGTQGLVAASNADEVLTGSLVNARATAAYIKKRTPKLVSLVRMGHEASNRSEEDDICAAYLEAMLKDEPFNSLEIPKLLRESPCSSRFFDPEQIWNPPSDFELCVRVDTFDFPIIRKTEQTFAYLEPLLQSKA